MTPCKNKELRLPAKSILCSERVARPARSELLAPPEASCSPRSKRVARPTRSVLLTPLGASCSLHSKGIARSALSIRAAVLEPYQYSCSKTADSPALRVSPALLRTVTPQSNALYYFIVSPYSAGNTGAAAFHVYVSE